MVGVALPLLDASPDPILRPGINEEVRNLVQTSSKTSSHIDVSLSPSHASLMRSKTNDLVSPRDNRAYPGPWAFMDVLTDVDQDPMKPKHRLVVL